MTLQNLGKILDKNESELGVPTVPNQFELLKGVPFYNWSVNGNSDTTSVLPTVRKADFNTKRLQPCNRPTHKER
jgi:hypothetical protein